MTSSLSASNRRRRRIVVRAALLVLVVVLGAGLWWAADGRTRVKSESFWDYLEQHPTVAACLKPFSALAGKQAAFSNQIQFARIRRESAARRRETEARSAAAKQRLLDMQTKMLDAAKRREARPSPPMSEQSSPGPAT